VKYLAPILLLLTASALWVVTTIVAAFYGVWLDPIAREGASHAFFDAAVQIIDEQNKGNAALMLIENGEIAHEYYDSVEDPVDQNTLFPTASFSKWVAAWGVMSLVEAGKVDLDLPVSGYLSRWQLPESEFDNDQVTVRRLLSHTAGLTDRLGFADYGADEEVPSIDDSLRSPGASRGDGVEISVGMEPGSEFLYSGGGYLILQLLVEEVTGRSFAEYMHSALFEPLGMNRSTYAFIGELENVSASFDRNGMAAPMYRYAASSATGFSSTASDLAKFVRSQLPETDIASPVAQETLDAMRQPHAFTMGAPIWGLGTMLYTRAPQEDFVFGHDGGNEPAINSSVRINPETGDAFIMLINGHPSLATTIGSHWVLWQTGYPDFLSLGVALESAVTPSIVGIVVLLMLFGVVLWRRAR